MAGIVSFDFQISIHPPLVGWDDPETVARLLRDISIHPPLVGWDFGGYSYSKAQSQFQSTHPLWGGTFPPQNNCGHDSISIHPPLVGWDLKKEQDRINLEAFQSTHPLWGGTNSRCFLWLYVGFQSTHPLWGGTQIIFYLSIPF